jgi:hypothetical protein
MESTSDYINYLREEIRIKDIQISNLKLELERVNSLLNVCAVSSWGKK